MNSLRSAALLVAALVCFLAVDTHSLLAQRRFESKANGAWTSNATWTVTSGSPSTGTPSAIDTAIIHSPNTVTVAGTTVNCAKLIVDNGGTLSLTGAGNAQVNGNPGSATINGTVLISGSGTLQKAGTGTKTLVVGPTGKVTISGTAATPSFDVYTLDPASTFEYTATANQTILSGVTFGNLTLAGSGTKTIAPVPVADTTFRMNGTLTVGTGVIFDVSTNILRIYFNGNVVNNGTIDASVGITVVYVNGASWVNNGTYVPSATSGYGYQPGTYFNNNTTVSGTSPLSFYDLIVNGAMTVSSPATVAHNVIISAASTLTAGAGSSFAIAGNWSNSGTYAGGTAPVTFNGTAVQDIGAGTFASLTLNNALGATLSGNVSAGSITLTAGSVNTGAYGLTVTGTAPAALTLGANTITGTVTRAIDPVSTGTYNFLSTQAFVTPNGTGNPATITMTVYPNTNPPSLAQPSDTSVIAKRYYAIQAVGTNGSFAFALQLPYAASEVRGRQVDYRLWENDGTGWLDRGLGGPVDTVNHVIGQTGLAGGSSFWLIGENVVPLPIQLATFKVQSAVATGDVTLAWTTLSETDNYGFVLQRSATNAAGFVDLPNSFVPGHGTTTQAHQYQWTDKVSVAGVYLYRLKQIDRDGTIAYSEAIKANISVVTGVNGPNVPAAFALAQNFPNPFNPSTHITFTVEREAFTTIVVYNILGSEIATLFAAQAHPGIEYSVTFDASSLANGTYFYRLTSGEKSTLRKMILLK